jgi:6-phosphogluconolactonase
MFFQIERNRMSLEGRAMKIWHRYLVLLALFLAVAAAAFAREPRRNIKNSYLVYVGTYTGPTSKGIYAFRFDAGSGKATSVGVVGETPNPSFLAIDRSRSHLYAVNEVGDYQGQKSGGVSAFSIDRKTGKLTFLNEVSSRGAGPCYLTLDKTGKYVLVANYDAGNVAVFPVLDDGRLAEASTVIQHTGHGPNAERQEGPHAHEIELSPDNHFAVTSDLGLDKLLVYRFDASNGTLAVNNTPVAELAPGSGPRHFVFHPKGKFLYAISEMGGTVTAFRYDARTGMLHSLQTISTLPKEFTGKNDSAEIEVHPSGKFLYGSNRGPDDIAVFAINRVKGTLTTIDHVPTKGKTPRNFAIDPSGRYLFAANQGSNNIVVFRIHPSSGRLTSTGQVLEVPSPVCVKFVATE